MSGLINGAKIYFTDKSELAEIFASPDGQYFYEKGTCLSYCTNNNLKLPITITRDEVFPFKVKVISLEEIEMSKVSNPLTIPPKPVKAEQNNNNNSQKRNGKKNRKK